MPSSSLRRSFGRIRPPAALLAAGFGLLAMAWEGRAPRADTSPVIARVGSVTITAAELEHRLAAVPTFQLRAFGATPAEIKARFLERVLVREALLGQGGAARGLGEREDVKDHMRSVMRGQMIAHLKAEAMTSVELNDQQIKDYYEQNAAKFHAPERLGLWTITLAKRGEAEEVLTEMKRDPSPKHWSAIARERSIDHATAFHGGDLGFVGPDGTTSEPGLKVSRAVLDAAEKVKDGEMIPTPVQDGDHWTVIWRRQSLKPVNRPVELEAGSIKQMLLHMRAEAKLKETLTRLRKEHLTEHNAELLDLLDVTPGGELTPVRRPGALPAGKRVVANPVPTPGSQR
jgi:peptidyl-prolyl cis-trans isomerase C